MRRIVVAGSDLPVDRDRCFDIGSRAVAIGGLINHFIYDRIGRRGIRQGVAYILGRSHIHLLPNISLNAIKPPAAGRGHAKALIGKPHQFTAAYYILIREHVRDVVG